MSTTLLFTHPMGEDVSGLWEQDGVTVKTFNSVLSLALQWLGQAQSGYGWEQVLIAVADEMSASDYALLLVAMLVASANVEFREELVAAIEANRVKWSDVPEAAKQELRKALCARTRRGDVIRRAVADVGRAVRIMHNTRTLALALSSAGWDEFKVRAEPTRKRDVLTVPRSEDHPAQDVWVTRLNPFDAKGPQMRMVRSRNLADRHYPRP